MALQLSNASTKSIIDGDLEKEASLSMGEGRRLSKVAFRVSLSVGGRIGGEHDPSAVATGAQFVVVSFLMKLTCPCW